MKMILALFFIFVFLTVPFVRFVCANIHNIAFYSPKDIYDYFKYKKYNLCPAYGYIRIFNGYFGSGKSLSAVQEVISMYKHYNGLEIFDENLNSFIKQKITIISNLKLYGVPYIAFDSEQQFVEYETEPGEVVIFLIDEIGTVWNNRDFKNFNPDVFNNIVQSRKRKMSIYGTLPVFQGTDISIRRYTSDVIFCEKHWRFIKQRTFDPNDIENCSNINMVQPLRLKYLFVKDIYYNQYDTTELVDKLKRDMQDGKLMTFNELNVDSGKSDIKVARLKKKFIKRQK
jgi:hypothetical protein